MKKAIIGLAAVGAVIALRPIAQRLGQTMRGRCEQMSSHCSQMAAHCGGRDEAISAERTPEHSEQMVAA